MITFKQNAFYVPTNDEIINLNTSLCTLSYGKHIRYTYLYFVVKEENDELKFNVIILSQSYNATVFHFDSISFLEHVLNQLFLPNESSISQASYRTMVLTICFQLFKKQTILWR